jgi:hypothetical protein
MLVAADYELSLRVDFADCQGSIYDMNFEEKSSGYCNRIYAPMMNFSIKAEFNDHAESIMNEAKKQLKCDLSRFEQSDSYWLYSPRYRH